MYETNQKFRPQSLSIVTVSEEVQQEILNIKRKLGEKLSEEETDQQEPPRIQRKNSRKFSASDLVVRQIVYGQNDPEEEDSEEDNYEKLKEASYHGNQVKPLPHSSAAHSSFQKQNQLQVEPDRLIKMEQSVSNNHGDNNLRSFKSILKASPVQRVAESALEITSIGECSMGNSSDQVQITHQQRKSSAKLMQMRMNKLFSVIYAIALVVIGAIITISDMSSVINDRDHLYNIVVTLIGVVFLVFLHYDIQRQKRFVMKWQSKQKELISSPLKVAESPECDSISVTTTKIFNYVYSLNKDEIDDATKKTLNSYRFLTGKHSGSFYLKIGMTLFCMGSIVHQGINFAMQVYFFTADGSESCTNGISFFVYSLRCISAFYQLYIAFKYSNLIVNRFHSVVRFGLMHMVGSSLSFWFSTIIEEAMDGYMNKVKLSSLEKNTTFVFDKAYNHYIECSNRFLANFESIDAMFYFYPFSIEFNIILASVWYIIWTNVENDDSSSQLPHIQEDMKEDHRTGVVDINYRSNVTVSVDCHSSNVGMFTGFVSLLLTVISIIIFFTTIKHNDYKNIGIILYSCQFGFLTVCSMIVTPLAHRKLNLLNVSKHLDSSQTSMDDFLLVAPLPFYYIHHILSIYAELSAKEINWNGILLVLIYATHLVQVTWQTPFIIDGIRRCSNERKLRFQKPGKELITFSIIINVTLWILLTFEIKSVDKHHSMAKEFGKFVWMIILDTCLPLMLFYRFHSSVCLSDMWKNAYEKDDH